MFSRYLAFCDVLTMMVGHWGWVCWLACI